MPRSPLPISLSHCLALLTLILLTLSVSSVTKIRHKQQLMHCLRICNQQISNCINLRHDKCLRTYHTCLEKAKDFYRCANSSQIKQMKALSKCIQLKCEEIQEEGLQVLENNPYRTMHRGLGLCLPWLAVGAVGIDGKVMAPEDMFRQCERYLCKQIVRANGDGEEGSQEGSSGSCSALAQPTLIPDLSCSGGAFGKEGRSSVAILSGHCLNKE